MMNTDNTRANLFVKLSNFFGHPNPVYKHHKHYKFGIGLASRYPKNEEAIKLSAAIKRATRQGRNLTTWTGVRT